MPSRSASLSPDYEQTYSLVNLQPHRTRIFPADISRCCRNICARERDIGLWPVPGQAAALGYVAQHQRLTSSRSMRATSVSKAIPGSRSVISSPATPASPCLTPSLLGQRLPDEAVPHDCECSRSHRTSRTKRRLRWRILATADKCPRRTVIQLAATTAATAIRTATTLAAGGRI